MRIENGLLESAEQCLGRDFDNSLNHRTKVLGRILCSQVWDFRTGTSFRLIRAVVRSGVCVVK